MIRIAYTLLLLFVPMSLLASPLKEISEAVKALGRYEVGFTVDGEMGEYWVDGERYHLSFGGQEIYGDGDVRYSINHRYREIVVERDAQDVALPVVVANPTTAFTSLDRLFRVVESVEGDGRAVLSLEPKARRLALSGAVVEMDMETKLPTLVTYFADGESVTIKINRFVATKKYLSPHLPEGYEMIDIR